MKHVSIPSALSRAHSHINAAAPGTSGASHFANLAAIQRTKQARSKPTFIHLDLWMAGVTGLGT